MKKHTVVIVVFTCCLGVSAAQDAKKEMTALQGSWKVVNYKGPEEAFAKEFKSKGKIIFEGDKLTIMIGDVKLGEATYKLDPSKKPKTMDAVSTFGPDKGQKSLAIYELDGDKLKICITEEKDRPKEFATKKGSKTTILDYQREKK